MAKDLSAPYLQGKRKGMAKVKRERTIDCVVMGWRPGKEEGTVGSLILGLYKDDELCTVGHISGFSKAAKQSMRAMLAPLETGEAGTAEPSRWTGGRDLEWVALRPELPTWNTGVTADCCAHRTNSDSDGPPPRFRYPPMSEPCTG